MKLIEQVTEIHFRGEFEERSWTSNSQKVLSALPKESLASGTIDLELYQIQIEKTSRLISAPHSDIHGFNIKLTKTPGAIRNGSMVPTEREMLRVTMSVFDLLGFLCPFTIWSKIL